jgi:hypothetical protein
MLDALESNGVKTVLVEDASGFARKVIVQETRHRHPDCPQGRLLVRRWRSRTH